MTPSVVHLCVAHPGGVVGIDNGHDLPVCLRTFRSLSEARVSYRSIVNSRVFPGGFIRIPYETWQDLLAASSFTEVDATLVAWQDIEAD